MTNTKILFVQVAEELYELFSRFASKTHPESVIREQAQTFLLASVEGFRMAPNRKLGTSAKTRELLRIEDAARALFSALEESHISTRSMLVEHLIVPTDFNDAHRMARRIQTASGSALAEAREERPTETDKGPPKQLGLTNVTRLAASMFEFLTGKTPTVIHRPNETKHSKQEVGDYGPFIDFLKAIYKILGIKASATSQARGYLEKPKTTVAPSGQ